MLPAMVSRARHILDLLWLTYICLPLCARVRAIILMIHTKICSGSFTMTTTSGSADEYKRVAYVIITSLLPPCLF